MSTSNLMSHIPFGQTDFNFYWLGLIVFVGILLFVGISLLKGDGFGRIFRNDSYDKDDTSEGFRFGNDSFESYD